MSPAGRFRVDAWRSERRGVATADGHEAATGLPVRIRRFAGSPRGDPVALDHPSLPGVIDVLHDGDATRLITLVPRGYASLAERPEPLNLRAVHDAVEAVAALHAAGIVHGDLGPHRIEVGPGHHLLIDGAGAPWRGPDGETPTAADDVRALAGALLGAGADLPPGVVRALERAAVHPGDDSDATSLLRTLDAATGDAAGGVTGDAAGGAASSDPPPVRAAEVVKDLPPGGVYRSGESRDPLKPSSYALDGGAAPDRTGGRLPWRGVALFAAALTLGVAGIVLQRRADAPEGPGATAGSFIVDVRVDPGDAPPLQLVVRDAPSGSELTPGTRLGRAPRRVELDTAGRWVLQGTFGDRLSDAATFRVPETTAVTLDFRPDGDDVGDGDGNGDGGDGDASFP